jgi:hypothetical protein
MAPFEALYGRKCRSPVCWNEIGEVQITGPELIQETTDKIFLIRNNLHIALSRQKIYTDKTSKTFGIPSQRSCPPQGIALEGYVSFWEEKGENLFLDTLVL